MIEKLESRRLMSSGVTSSLSGGSLTVTGGADGGTLSVDEHNGNVWVNSANPNISDATTADYHAVTVIAINGQAKNDVIFYTGDTVGAQIDAGGGNDAISVDDLGSGSTSATGNGGDDDLVVLHSHNTTVVGGGGNDNLFLNTASDNTASNVVYAYGLGGKDYFAIYGGTVITDATKQDTVADFS
jgi:hypothetical protein